MKSKNKIKRRDERPDELVDANVLAFLEALEQPAGLRQIAHGMGLKHHGRRYLPRVLNNLKRSGQVEEVHPGGRYRIAREKLSPSHKPIQLRPADKPRPAAASEAEPQNVPPAPKPAVDASLIPGRFVAHRDGYGFLVPDKPIAHVDGDLFIPPNATNDAMHGDRVLARVGQRRADGRAEGRIVQIANRAHPTVVGLFRYEIDGNYVLPYDTRMQSVLIPPGEELTPALSEKLGAVPDGSAAARRRRRLPELDGAVVVDAQITRYPRGGRAPAGRVIEILGRPGDIGGDVEIMIRKHHIPHEFPENVLAEARSVPQQVSEAALRGRKDFRHLSIVTIDGETARDFDDAVHVSERAEGGYELQVHIADVAHYVRRGAPLDQEARLRGTSVYFPNRAVPMLPEELSNGICSLNPHVDRLVMSAL